MQRVLVPLMTCLAVLAGPALALIGAGTPAPGGLLLVVGPYPEDAIRHAGSRPVGPAAAPFAAFAAASDAGFPARARDGGAWLVLDGRIIAAICGAVS